MMLYRKLLYFTVTFKTLLEKVFLANIQIILFVQHSHVCNGIQYYLNSSEIFENIKNYLQKM